MRGCRFGWLLSLLSVGLIKAASRLQLKSPGARESISNQHACYSSWITQERIGRQCCFLCGAFGCVSDRSTARKSGPYTLHAQLVIQDWSVRILVETRGPPLHLMTDRARQGSTNERRTYLYNIWVSKATIFPIASLPPEPTTPNLDCQLGILHFRQLRGRCTYDILFSRFLLQRGLGGGGASAKP